MKQCWPAVFPNGLVCGVAKLRDVCRGSRIYSLAFDVIQRLFLSPGQLSLILPLPCPWHDKYEVSILVCTDIQSDGAWWLPAHRLSWIPRAISSACLVAPPSSGTIRHAYILLMGLIKKTVWFNGKTRVLEKHLGEWEHAPSNKMNVSQVWILWKSIHTLHWICYWFSTPAPGMFFWFP